MTINQVKDISKKTVQVVVKGLTYTLDKSSYGLKFLSDLISGAKKIKVSVTNKE